MMHSLAKKPTLQEELASIKQTLQKDYGNSPAQLLKSIPVTEAFRFFVDGFEQHNLGYACIINFFNNEPFYFEAISSAFTEMLKLAKEEKPPLPNVNLLKTFHKLAMQKFQDKVRPENTKATVAGEFSSVNHYKEHRPPIQIKKPKNIKIQPGNSPYGWTPDGLREDIAKIKEGNPHYHLIFKSRGLINIYQKAKHKFCDPTQMEKLETDTYYVYKDEKDDDEKYIFQYCDEKSHLKKIPAIDILLEDKHHDLPRNYLKPYIINYHESIHFKRETSLNKDTVNILFKGLDVDGIVNHILANKEITYISRAILINQAEGKACSLEREKYLTDRFSVYNKMMLEAKTDSEKIEHIVFLVADINKFHPFVDGNTRTCCFLLLNYLLMTHGFPPVILHNPNHFDSWSKGELIAAVVQGMQNTLALAKDKIIYHENIHANDLDDFFPKKTSLHDTLPMLTPSVSYGEAVKNLNPYFDTQLNYKGIQFSVLSGMEEGRSFNLAPYVELLKAAEVYIKLEREHKYYMHFSFETQLECDIYSSLQNVVNQNSKLLCKISIFNNFYPVGGDSAPRVNAIFASGYSLCGDKDNSLSKSTAEARHVREMILLQYTASNFWRSKPSSIEEDKQLVVAYEKSYGALRKDDKNAPKKDDELELFDRLVRNAARFSDTRPRSWKVLASKLAKESMQEKIRLSHFLLDELKKLYDLLEYKVGTPELIHEVIEMDKKVFLCFIKDVILNPSATQEEVISFIRSVLSKKDQSIFSLLYDIINAAESNSIIQFALDIASNPVSLAEKKSNNEYKVSAPDCEKLIALAKNKMSANFEKKYDIAYRLEAGSISQLTDLYEEKKKSQPAQASKLSHYTPKESKDNPDFIFFDHKESIPISSSTLRFFQAACVPVTSRFKFCINLANSSFISDCNNVMLLLDSLCHQFKDTVDSFKMIKAFFNTAIQRKCLAFWSHIKDNPLDFKNAVTILDSIPDEFIRNTLKESYRRYSNFPSKIRDSEILSEYQYWHEASIRFKENSQCVIYFLPEIDEPRIVEFAHMLDKQLQTMNLSPGVMDKLDSRITRFISCRYDRMKDGDPYDASINDFTSVSSINELSDDYRTQLESSSLYQTLKKSFAQEAKIPTPAVSSPSAGQCKKAS